jgi:hypothetical protein
MPQQFVPDQYAPPAATAPPTEASGFFGGPVPHAPPPTFGGPPSQFGTPAPSQFGTPGGQFGQFGGPAVGNPMGPPAIPYAVTTARSGRSKIVATAAAVVVALLVTGAVPRVMDRLHQHHTSALPAAVAGYSQLDAATEAGVSQGLQASMPAKFKGKLTNLQAAVYSQGGAAGLFVATADVPAGTQRHANEAFSDDDGTNSFHDVTAPASSFGGKVMCTSYEKDGQATPACGWVDDGTFGLVLVPGSDEATALSLLAEVRAATEH